MGRMVFFCGKFEEVVMVVMVVLEGDVNVEIEDVVLFC